MLCVECMKTAANVPESARICLLAMLRAIMENRNGQSGALFFYNDNELLVRKNRYLPK